MRMQQMNIEQQNSLLKAQTAKTVLEAEKLGLSNTVTTATMDQIIRGAGLTNDLKESSLTTMQQSRYESEQRIRESTMRMGKIAADTDFTLDENKRAEIRSALQQKLTDEQIKNLAARTLTEMQRKLVVEIQKGVEKNRQNELYYKQLILKKQEEFLRSDKTVDQALRFLQTIMR